MQQVLSTLCYSMGGDEPGRQSMLLLPRDTAEARELGAAKQPEGTQSTLGMWWGRHRVWMVYSIPEAYFPTRSGK